MELISKESATDSVFSAFECRLKVMEFGGLICTTDFDIMIVAEDVACNLSCLGSKVFTLN
jgi:hypothetical protein